MKRPAASPAAAPDRRRFLLGGLAGALVATRIARGTSLLPRGEGPRSLVLVQLTGGNDGLSTVVPFAEDAYHAARPTLAHAAERVLRLDERVGLHPGLAGLRALFDAGRLAIVQGVGYPRPVRSHFKALEIWHTGDHRGRASGEGWVGRLAAAAWPRVRDPELLVHLGPSTPYSMHSTSHPAVSLQSPSGYAWFGDDLAAETYAQAGEQMATERPATGGDALLARLRGVLGDASESSRRIREAAARHAPAVEYPRDRFGAALRDVAALVHGGLGTRVVSTSLNGFDTHASQRGPHDRLMASVDSGLTALLADLATSQAGRDALVVVFSEFGRRVRENGSRGTDHGKAGPVLVLGHQAAGGIVGEHPSLTELDDGDLVHELDFRSVYGTVVERWFGLEHSEVLGERFPLLPLVAG